MDQPFFSRLRRLVIFIAVQAVIALLLLEVIARFTDPLGISYYPETARFFDTMIHEEPIAYRLRPGLDGVFHGARYQINSIGLRGDELPGAKALGERRILFLGDSVVFGIGVNNKQTIPAVLERILNEGQRTGGVHRVINMGVPSYNTEQEAMQFVSYANTLQPDAVLLMVSPNDTELKNWVFEKRANLFADLGQRSYAVATLFVLARRLKNSLNGPSEPSSTPGAGADEARLAAIAESLNSIKAMCDKRGIPFVVFVPNSPDEFLNRFVIEEGRRSGFDAAVLNPTIDPRWPNAETGIYQNSPSDSHCNAKGCEMWAQAAFEALEKNGFVSP